MTVTSSMPSKGKKHSNGFRKASDAAVDSPSSLKSSSSSSPLRTSSNTTKAEDFSGILEEASRRFPSLIGKSAIVGQLKDVDPQLRGCTVWLSESSMITHALAPGSTVSVSLASKENPSGCLPLHSPTKEYSRPELGHEGYYAKDLGLYFSLSTVLPSSKVQKNEVRVSSSLFHTLDCPSSGTTVFIYSFPVLSSNSILNKHVSHAEEIHLKLLPLKTREVDPSFHCLTESKNSVSSTRGERCSVISSVEEALRDGRSNKLLQSHARFWLDRRKLLRGNLIAVPFLSELLFFRLSGVNCSSSAGFVFVIDQGTNIVMSLSPCFIDEKASKEDRGSGVPKLGGLSKEYAILKDIILSSMKCPFSSLGLKTTKGVLLHGPSGTGKSSLVRMCAHDTGVRMFSVTGFDELVNVFNLASCTVPSVVFIDELDGIAHVRKGGDELSDRTVPTLLTLMDGIQSVDGLLVIAATNRLDLVHPALRRAGRFHRNIEIPVPSAPQRSDIFRAVLASMSHSLTDADIRAAAASTHSFVGADISALCTRAALTALRRPSPSIAPEDLRRAMSGSMPSGVRGAVAGRIPEVRWDDIGGYAGVKRRLREMVDRGTTSTMRPPSGVLMFGPPGCSKTLMARAVATESGLGFFLVNGPQLFSKYVGESEKNVRSVFAKARAAVPSVVFLDEFDGLASVRGPASVSGRVVSQLLVELDGLHERAGVSVIAATNRPDKIDPALLRPGRFDRHVYVGPPDERDREEILRIHLRKTPCNADVDVTKVARVTGGRTGADIRFICREAAVFALDEDLSSREIFMRHLEKAVRELPPLSREGGLWDYQELPDKFRRLVVSDGVHSDGEEISRLERKYELHTELDKDG